MLKPVRVTTRWDRKSVSWASCRSWCKIRSKSM